jgi:hypothetical protein
MITFKEEEKECKTVEIIEINDKIIGKMWKNSCNEFQCQLCFGKLKGNIFNRTLDGSGYSKFAALKDACETTLTEAKNAIAESEWLLGRINEGVE